MKISVITTSNNSIKTIEKTIKSIFSQTHQNIEKVWIDNASTDGTLNILNKYKDENTILISEKDFGIYDAFNKGIKKSSGEIISFLNSDDFYYDENVLLNVSQKFEKSNIDILFGNINYVKSDNSVLRKWVSLDKKLCGKLDQKLITSKINFGWMPPHPGFFIKRRSFNHLFDTNYKIAADYDFMLRSLLKKENNIYYLNKFIVKMLIGGNSNNLKNIIKKMIEDYKIIKKNNIGGLHTLVFKNLRKLNQFF